MAERRDFDGMPAAGLAFLAELAENNDRDWFNANKQRYLDQVQGPAQALVVALGERLQRLSSGISYDSAANGSGSLMRIYRDTRFSRDKTPYKTAVSMSFWEGPSKREAFSGFYLRLSPRGAELYTGVHGFDRSRLERFREAVADERAGPALQTAMERVRAAGDYEVGGAHYRRVPRGYAPDHPRADLLRYNTLFAHHRGVAIAPNFVTSAALVDQAAAHFAAMLPIHRWLVDHLAPTAQ